MNTRQFWTVAEETTLLDLAQRGATAAEIADALPGRTAYAVRIRRRRLGHGPGHLTPITHKAPLGERVVGLIATIERARRERRAKAYIRQLRLGMIVLRARERGV